MLKGKYLDFTGYSVISGPSTVCKYSSNPSLVQVVLLDDSTWAGQLGGAHMEGGGA